MGKGTTRLPRAPDELDHGDVKLARALRHGAMTRAELADTTGWSRNTVATRIDRLMAEGWVIETADQPDGERGRPSQRYRLNPHAALIFVVQFDVARFDARIVTLQGEVMASTDRDIADDFGGEAAAMALQEALSILTATPGITPGLVRLAVIGVRGPVAAQTQTVPWSSPGVLPAGLAGRLGMRVVVENDANLMALGAARQMDRIDSLLFILVQTGIGAGLVLGGHLHRGLQGWSGEIGHIPVAAAGDLPCPCGNRGCVAMIASNPALLAAISTPERPIATVGDLERHVQAGDIAAIGALRQAGRHIGEATIGLIVGLAPEVIAVGGNIGLSGGHVLTGIRESVSRLAPPALSSRLEVVAAPEASLTSGALVLALDNLFG